MQVIIKVKNLPANLVASNTFCDLIIYALSKKNIKEILYRDITSPVVQQISDYLFPESERRTVCPDDQYPYLKDYIPQQYIKPIRIDREAIYKVLVEKDAEFILNLPIEETA